MGTQNHKHLKLIKIRLVKKNMKTLIIKNYLLK